MRDSSTVSESFTQKKWKVDAELIWTWEVSLSCRNSRWNPKSEFYKHHLTHRFPLSLMSLCIQDPLSFLIPQQPGNWKCLIGQYYWPNIGPIMCLFNIYLTFSGYLKILSAIHSDGYSGWKKCKRFSALQWWCSIKEACGTDRWWSVFRFGWRQSAD